MKAVVLLASVIPMDVVAQLHAAFSFVYRSHLYPRNTMPVSKSLVLPVQHHTHFQGGSESFNSDFLVRC